MCLNLILAFSSDTTSNLIEIFMQFENTHFIATKVLVQATGLWYCQGSTSWYYKEVFLIFCIMTRQMLIGPGRQQHCSAYSLPRIRNNLDDMNYFMKVTEQEFLLSLLAHCKTHNSLTYARRSLPLFQLWVQIFLDLLPWITELFRVFWLPYKHGASFSASLKLHV